MTKNPPLMSETPAPAALNTAEVTAQHPSKASYPPISSIPSISPERLAQSAADTLKDLKPPSETVLYLAYGSNLCAQTFLGARRIRPLSRVNVWAPSLRLTFDLPALPYREPCFANVGHRDPPDESNGLDFSNIPPFEFQEPEREWKNGLVGVVYEVTQKDYSTILRTEGAGSSYKEIVVPCLPLPPDDEQGGNPAPSISKPFLARTLYAPRTPCDPDESSWWCKLTSGRHRPEGQPSARYLKLLADGAREHSLPNAYQQYLRSLQPYVATTLRQKIGGILFIVFWAPPMLVAMGIMRLLVNKRGKAPSWLANLLTVTFNLMWIQYDHFFKPLFGDGERTEVKKDKWR
ncbi:Gamma-glutamyl cyclotransferase gliK [Cladobotryum mycophilum]|uniref:gamma-glutamylcyclotransferase n=1 Tax=Cladobotryum mycophilum TaxID=491253 RepID=A0ABR0S9W0_9HYPO